MGEANIQINDEKQFVGEVYARFPRYATGKNDESNVAATLVAASLESLLLTWARLVAIRDVGSPPRVVDLDAEFGVLRRL